MHRPGAAPGLDLLSAKDLQVEITGDGTIAGDQRIVLLPMGVGGRGQHSQGRMNEGPLMLLEHNPPALPRPGPGAEGAGRV